MEGRRRRFTFDGAFQEDCEQISVAVRILPFDRGAMRQVHLMQQGSDAQVCKVGRWLTEAYGLKEVERDAKSLAVAAFLAAEFCKCCAIPQDHFKFVCSWVYECSSFDSWGASTNHILAGEPYLNTRFIKFNGNDGFVNMLDQSLEAQAFLHFTYKTSDERMMVADIPGIRQDGGLMLTDPQILSSWGGFGPGDLGRPGMRKCMESHECNYLCQRFKSLGPLKVDGMPKAQVLIDTHRLAQLCPRD